MWKDEVIATCAIDQSSGVLDISGSGVWDCFRYSQNGVPSQGFSAAVDLVDTGMTTSNGLYQYFAVFSGPTQVAFVALGGALSFVVVSGGTRSTLGSVPYDHAQHRRLRVSIVKDTCAWETYDGACWTLQQQAPSPFDGNPVSVLLGGGSTDASSTLSSARWDNVACR